MFTKYFSANQHDNKYNKYIDTNITKEEKDEFKKYTEQKQIKKNKMEVMIKTQNIS